MQRLHVMIIGAVALLGASARAQGVTPFATPAQPSNAAATATAAPTALLPTIMNLVRSAYAKQERPTVVFDLDATLFDNRPRTVQILKEYADEELKSARPEAAQKIATLTAPMVQYALTDTLKSLGVTEEAVVNNAAVFWSQRFFSDEYLRYDVPMPGAVNYVRSLYSAGARIVYVSGRDLPRQLLGSVRSLRDQGFPIGIQGTELIMKPSVQTADTVFKQQATNYLRQFGRVVAAFDSEANNVNIYRRAFADGKIVLFNTAHAPNAPPLLPNIDSLDKFE